MAIKSVVLVLALLGWSVLALSSGGSGSSGSGSSGSGSSGSGSDTGGTTGGGGDGGAWSVNSSQSNDPVLAMARSAIDKKDWAAAQALLQVALGISPDNASYHNLYADVIRKGPRPYDMELVLKHYGQALRIDSAQRGTHRYIGEAYLSIHDLAKARAHLAALDRICLLGCREFTELRNSITNFEASQRR